MINTSEFVSIGHPDKVADYISSKLLDEYLKVDPQTRFAVEVQVKDNFVTLAGEVTSKAEFDDKRIANIVRDAVIDIGYTHEYAMRWGAENAMDADALAITQHIGRQSPDIAQGVVSGGMGDQGIFWGMAVTSTADGMPKDHAIASKLGRKLYSLAKEKNAGWGLDIKTQVTLKDGSPIEVIVAIPCLTDEDQIEAERFVKSQFIFDEPKVIVNGTGRYVRHSAQGDCGTTGRKLAVDFYGGNCIIGGGSPWTKDGTKADVSLNLLARAYALLYLKSNQNEGHEKVFCSISCCIGKTKIRIGWYDEQMREIATDIQQVTVDYLTRRFDLTTPIFADLCKNGLFSRIK